MKWPWTRPADTDVVEAVEALNSAEENLEKAKSQWPEVHRVASSLRELRERNRFAESIEMIIRGEPT